MKIVDERLTKKTGGIAEICDSGCFPNTYNFRVPQAWSHWRKGKSIGNRTPGSQAGVFNIQTMRGKDEKPPCKENVQT